jgi:hypothetical protein
MTPTAKAPAGRRVTKRGTSAEAGHPRRPVRSTRPTAPRRISGPVRRRERVVAQPQTAKSIRARVAAFARSLPDHVLVDRLVRGRAWIPVLGVLLAGLVAMQVEVLKLGASIGRSIEQGSALTSQNQLLRASVASLADDQRIERLAASMGMVMPAPTAVGFLQARAGGDVTRALANIHAPDSSTFLAQLPSASVATAAPTSSGTGQPTSSTATSTTTAATTATAAAGATGVSTTPGQTSTSGGG